MDNLDGAEADGVRNLEEISKENAFADANQKTSLMASRELYSVGEVHEL